MLRPNRSLRPPCPRRSPTDARPPFSVRRSFEALRLFAATACLALPLLVALPSTSTAQVLLDDASPTWPVGRLELVYADPHPDHPDLAALLPVEVELQSAGSFWTVPAPGSNGETLVFDATEAPTRRLDAEALVAVLNAIVGTLNDAGYYGVDVRPSTRDFDLAAERDLRGPGRSALELVVRIGRINRIRTIAAGERVTSDWKIDNEIHHRIRRDSPLQPTGSGDDDATDLLDRRALEDYLHRLNRRSGRRVEAALSPAEEPGEVVLDYRVLEARPWLVYGQMSNTGTRRSNLWQARAGVVHRQLTDNDDVLSIDYLNAGGDDVNAVTARYQAPFFSSERPDWMTRRRGDPDWLDWIPREDIPWWGVDGLRWEGEFSFSATQAGNSPAINNLPSDFVKSQELLFGGRFIYETFQYRNFFVDLWTGLRVRELTVRNESQNTVGNALLVVPRIGATAERRSLISSLGLTVSLSGNVNGINETNRSALGRTNTDDRYSLFDFDLGYSTYLEPLFNPSGWRDPESHLSSTLAHEFAMGFRGQITLDDERLIPQANGTLGGLYSVRGYPQSIAVGDTLILSSFEYRFHVPRVLPISREALNLPLVDDFRLAPQQVYGRPDWDLILRAFVDIGHTRRNARGPALALNERHQTLIGAGVGAELLIRSNIRARIDWAMALKSQNMNPAASTSGRSGVTPGDSEIHALISILY